jgi:hypothetical protein
MNTLHFLEQRVASLGNHYQKHIFTIKRFKDSLIATIDAAGKSMQINLWQASPSIEQEMQIIREISADQTKQVQHVSCYYALQYLIMLFRHLDILELGVASNENISDTQQRFMIQLGSDYRELTRAYLSTLLNIYIPAEDRPEFFVCSVGTRADQDDIDIGIVTLEEADAAGLNHAFQKITQNMLVYATPLHLHLSEHVGKHVYTTTIAEYKRLLKRQIRDVVILSELLNANIILGSEKLFRRFKKEVTSRYYSNSRLDTRFHEGYLRGILGETRSMLITPPSKISISPKDDVLRMLKLILHTKKTIFNLDHVNSWDIVNAMLDNEPHLKTEYELIFKALSFLELFKFLLQLYIVPEETFRPREIDNKQLAIIAEMMGYKPIGTVSAWDQLIIDYYRYIREIRKVCDFLLEDITNYLSSITIFLPYLKTYHQQKKKSLARDFIHSARFFAGTKYWEDMLKLLENDVKLVDEFIQSLENLEEHRLKKVIQSYIEWARVSSISVIRLLTIIGKRQHDLIGRTVFIKLCHNFFQIIESLPYTTERLCRIYSYYPQYIHEFLELLPDEHFNFLDRILEKSVINEMLKPYQLQLRELINIHNWSGQYFHRFFSRIIENNPQYLRSFSNVDQLSKIASGLLAMVDVYPDIERQKIALGDYYDLEFLRVGMGTMRGVSLKNTNREFTIFCDKYIEKLFTICSKEVETETGEISTTDAFAILAAGGHGRKQAYDDDYDLVAIIESEDEDTIKYATRIITKMNREIVRRGVLPHYRLGEILGSYISPLPKIVDYLKSQEDESFIDLSQLLGARIVIGNEQMRRIINKEILDRFIFKRKTVYLKRMINEVYNRQDILEHMKDKLCSLKEDKGGLRDIEAIALMLKAYLEITTPLSENFFEEIKPKITDIENELETISKSMYFLRTVRNLYRLMVSAEDKVNPDYLDRLSPILRDRNGRPLGNSKVIMNRINKTLNKSAAARDSIIQYFRLKLNIS